VSWNAPFKAKIRQQYDDWMMHGDRALTSGGNPRPPPMTIYLNWIYEAWKSIPGEAIANSFKTCGITNALDGSEDNDIHCFKADGPIPSCLPILQQARLSKQLNDFLMEEIDLEQDEENGYLSDTSLFGEDENVPLIDDLMFD
jgi:hypothetical protein